MGVTYWLAETLDVESLQDMKRTQNARKTRRYRAGIHGQKNAREWGGHCFSVNSMCIFHARHLSMASRRGEISC
ncbi:hypothetical protein [Pseudomonas fluorescens]|uniref:hypothetical protein n=1 Tax=Pseudomonas fluorescens TaxID=294 RepID=UPI001240CEFD|nr:hypothetical protein [Pseudomonas fluorescens]